MTNPRRRPSQNHLEPDFKKMSQSEVVNYAERLSDEYRAVMTLDEYFDQQTGVVAVLQKSGGGPQTRKMVQLNSGLNRERRMTPRMRELREQADEIHAWAKENGYTPKQHLVQEGPFVRGKKAYEKLPGGGKADYNQKLRNLHHAEMKVKAWSEANGYDIVAMAPTRGCCPGCQAELKGLLGDKFREVVPESRQTPEAFKRHMAERLFNENALARNVGQAQPAPAEPSVGKLPAERLPAGKPAVETSALETRLPPAKLLAASEKLFKASGRAMIVLDGLTTAADVATKLRQNDPAAAGKSATEFGGRASGGFVGGAYGAEAGAIFGSVVPGPGTVVGALAGGLIGGVVGAAVGQEVAGKLYERLQQLADPNRPQPNKPGPEPRSRAIDARLVDDNVRRYADPGVRELQKYLYDRGNSSPQVNLVCSAVTSTLADIRHTNPSATVADAFDVLSSRAAEAMAGLVSPRQAGLGQPSEEGPVQGQNQGQRGGPPRLPAKRPSRSRPNVMDWPIVGPRG